MSRPFLFQRFREMKGTSIEVRRTWGKQQQKPEMMVKQQIVSLLTYHFCHPMCRLVLHREILQFSVDVNWVSYNSGWHCLSGIRARSHKVMGSMPEGCCHLCWQLQIPACPDPLLWFDNLLEWLKNSGGQITFLPGYYKGYNSRKLSGRDTQGKE